MLKTAVIGKTANGTTQLSRLTVMSGDRIVLVDATTGQPPKKVTTKMVNKDLHIFAEGATEPSVILNDYASFDQTVQISGVNASGAYVNYATVEAGSMELGAVSAEVAPASAPLMSTSAWWGVGILAVAGGVAAAAGGGGDSTTTTTTTPTTSTTPDTTASAPVIAVVATDDIVNLAENTSLVISGTGEIGASVTLAATGQTAVVNSSGSWSIIVSDAALSFGQGSETLSVTQTDVAGNTSVATTRVISVDTIAPVLTIIDDESAVTANIAGGDIVYTFTFDEAVTGFDSTDILIDPLQGTAKTFTTVSPTEYTLGVTPLGGYEGNMTISVDNASYMDLAGNFASLDIASSQVVDMLAPVFSSTVDPVAHSSNESIVLTYSELLEAVNMSNPASFTVTVDADGAGVGVAVPVTVASVGMLNNQVILTLATGFDAGAVVAVMYADVTADTTPAIQDIAGNDATSFSWQYLTAVI